jgi:hypothetical protein
LVFYGSMVRFNDLENVIYFISCFIGFEHQNNWTNLNLTLSFLFLVIICGPIMFFYSLLRGDLQSTLNFPYLFYPGFQVLLLVTKWLEHSCMFENVMNFYALEYKMSGCDGSIMCFYFLYKLHCSFKYNCQLSTYTSNLW